MSLRTNPENTAWIEDDPVEYLDPDMNDEIFPDEFDASDEEHALDFDIEPRPKFFTARQRIEMAREERWLRSLTADFDDIDEFESFDDHMVGEFSH